MYLKTDYLFVKTNPIVLKTMFAATAFAARSAINVGIRASGRVSVTRMSNVRNFVRPTAAQWMPIKTANVSRNLDGLTYIVHDFFGGC